MEFSIFNIWLNKIYHLLKKKKKPSTRPTNGRKARKTKASVAPYWASGSGLPPSLRKQGFLPWDISIDPILSTRIGYEQRNQS